jgi:hypothetical protein
MFFFIIISPKLSAQENSEIENSINLDGPRVGITYIAPGKLADKLSENFDLKPFLTQFGWQFETRYFTLSNGTAGLVEGIILLGGVEQGAFLPSGSLLIGLRNKHGLEFGFGPNLSLAGAAFVLAAGITFHSDNINFPVNFAVIPSIQGIRLSILTGFNARRE